MLTRVQYERFSDKIADQIVGLIKSGKLKPGDSLPPEREMAKKLGVSGPPLREGLKILETLGFVEIQPRRKITIKSITGSSIGDPLLKTIEDDINMVIQLLEVRKILESWAASKASKLATKEDIEYMEEVFQNLERDFQSNQLGVDADARFHLAVYQAAHNTVLSHIGSTLFDLLWQAQKVTRETMFKEQDNRKVLLEQHFLILQSIKERNSKKAKAAILAHLNFAEKKIIELAHSED